METQVQSIQFKVNHQGRIRRFPMQTSQGDNKIHYQSFLDKCRSSFQLNKECFLQYYDERNELIAATCDIEFESAMNTQTHKMNQDIVCFILCLVQTPSTVQDDVTEENTVLAGANEVSVSSVKYPSMDGLDNSADLNIILKGGIQLLKNQCKADIKKRKEQLKEDIKEMKEKSKAMKNKAKGTKVDKVDEVKNRENRVSSNEHKKKKMKNLKMNRKGAFGDQNKNFKVTSKNIKNEIKKREWPTQFTNLVIDGESMLACIGAMKKLKNSETSELQVISNMIIPFHRVMNQDSVLRQTLIVLNNSESVSMVEKCFKNDENIKVMCAQSMQSGVDELLKNMIDELKKNESYGSTLIVSNSKAILGYSNENHCFCIRPKPVINLLLSSEKINPGKKEQSVKTERELNVVDQMSLSSSS